MTRKKKQRKTTSKNNPINGIGYKGEVKVSISNGRKILSTKTYSNAGTVRLFEFLASCLGGIYSDDGRPTVIRLYNQGTDTDPVHPTINETLAASSYISTTVPAVLNKDDNSAFVTIHFVIPFINIIATQTSERTIAKAALYNSRQTGASDYCAIYCFTKNNGKEFDPITIPGDAGNYSLIIDWILRITNK